jgi:protein involved in polysaccharide export with SLBB domain
MRNGVKTLCKRLGSMTRLLSAVAAVPVIGLAGCGAPITVPMLSSADVPRLAAAANLPDGPYRLEDGDTIQIRYVFHPELNQDALIRPDGRIHAADVGDIEIRGMTTTDVEKRLVAATSWRLKDPVVSVSVVKYSEKSIYVGGEVGKAGALPYRRGITLLQAIVAAGGFKETARPETVILIRPGQNDQFVARTIDLAKVVNDGAPEPLSLAPHDILMVPRSEIANADLWVKQHITDLFPLFRGATMPLPVF